MEKEITPRNWIRNLNKLIAEYNLICNQVRNGIQNNRNLTNKQNTDFGLWQGKVALLGEIDFYEYLYAQELRKAKGQYEDLNFQLTQCIKGVGQNGLENIVSIRHDINLQTLQEFYQKMWGLIMDKRFEVKNFYNLFLNPDFEAIDDKGKYIFKKKWEINEKDQTENARQFIWNIDAMLINYSSHYKVRGANERPPGEYSVDSHSTELKSRIEIEALIFTRGGAEKFIISHSKKIFGLMDRRDAIIKEYVLNHASRAHLNKLYFENLQILCNHYSWLVLEILPLFPELDLIPESVKEKVAKYNEKHGGERARENNSKAFGAFATQGTVKIPIKNNFDGVMTETVYDHFKAELVDKNYLGDDDLKRFLKAAFELRQPPTNKFKFSNSPTKKVVMAAFYRYYSKVAENPYRRQTEYAALLGKYFVGYKTETVSSNFAKSTY